MTGSFEDPEVRFGLDGAGLSDVRITQGSDVVTLNGVQATELLKHLICHLNFIEGH